MRIKSVTIENCKSYRFAETLEPNEDLTLLVGPNAGGKSNTLDVLTIILRKFFLQTYTMGEARESGVLHQDISSPNLFNPLDRFLDKNSARESEDTVVELVLEVGQTDVDNVQNILDKRADFEAALAGYRNKPIASLDFLDGWQEEMFEAGNTAAYQLKAGALNARGGIAEQFREYLNRLHLFILLARELDGIDLSPTFLYFSPYRSASPEDLNASLANDNFFNLLHGYFTTTSRGTTSLIKIATVFFAEKQRRLEVAAKDTAYGKAWTGDDDVVLATRYLRRLGYDWALRLVDPNKNTYEIALSREGRDFLISRASSGEKEILNFLFGVFALRTRGGLLVVDEPELHLHPRWQAVLRDLFKELADSTENQFLLSTHSPVFITPQTINNVRRVAKDKDGSTRLISISASEGGDSRSLLHIVNSHNNERIFFADKVVLVEGVQDRVLFREFMERYREAAEITEVVEVVEVHGKSNFDRYTRFLESLEVPRWIIADLDYGVDLRRGELEGLVEVRYGQIDERVLKSKKSEDRLALSEALKNAIEGGNPAVLEEIWRYIEGRFARLKPDLNGAEQTALNRTLEGLASEGIHVLKLGEIEDYLPAEHRSLDGTIELLEPSKLLDWLGTMEDNPGLTEIEGIVAAILGISEAGLVAGRGKVMENLREETARAGAQAAEAAGSGSEGETAPEEGAPVVDGGHGTNGV